MDNEQKYIAKRKIQAFFQSLPFYFFRIIPVDRKKIVIWTFEGLGGYADSPKYIVQELLGRNDENPYEIYWLVNKTGKEFPDGIREVKNTLLRRAYHLTTAAYWISNTRTFYGTKKRKQTKYIQTWHAEYGIKPIGRFRGDKLPKIAQICSEADSDMIDYLLCGNNRRYKEISDGFFYKGRIVRTGLPRVDVLINDRQKMREKYRRRFNLPADSKIVLYAPTFRGGSQKTSRGVEANASTIDFDRLAASLEKRFQGKWYVFLRLHPQVAAVISSMPVEGKCEVTFDVSQLPDMAEILASCDAVISDYSSVIFEAALLDVPIFLYIEDEEEYTKDRGDLRIRPEDLPFTVARNTKELLERVEDFDEAGYVEGIKKLMNENIGIFEDGKASKRVVDYLLYGTISEKEEPQHEC